MEQTKSVAKTSPTQDAMEELKYFNIANRTGRAGNFGILPPSQKYEISYCLLYVAWVDQRLQQSYIRHTAQLRLTHATGK